MTLRYAAIVISSVRHARVYSDDIGRTFCKFTMSTNKLSVVRYRYKTVHVLNEILRDDLNSSDDGSDFEYTSSDSECDNQTATFPPEAACKTPDVCEEHDQLNDSDHDCEDNVRSAENLPADDHGIIDVADNVDNDGVPNDDDCSDVMMSRCGSVTWKRQCPSVSRYSNQNILTEDRGVPVPEVRKYC